MIHHQVKCKTASRNKHHKPSHLQPIKIIARSLKGAVFVCSNLELFVMKYTCFFLLLFMFSCSQPRYVYNPPTRNLHYFTGKGEAVSAAWATGPSGQSGSTEKYNHGGDLQAAYSVSDHWAFSAAHYQRKEQDHKQAFVPQLHTNRIVVTKEADGS
jgi:hypothetical protein